ncbi:reverse transcriptase domain-containing protein [Tanacetum coccineum]
MEIKKNLQAYVDYHLVANQVNGSYIAKEPCMIQYLWKLKKLANIFMKFSIKQVPRSKNKKADILSKIASTSFAHLTKQVLVEVLKEKSINEAEVLTVVEEEGNTWMTSIYEYLTEETLPAKKKKARAVQIKSRWFGLPGEIISVNGKQFRDNPFKDWCEKLNIRQHFAFVKHPQTNGLVERENRSLGEGIKVRLDKRSKDWMEEVSYVLWAHCIMIKSSNGDTLFSLTYGTEAVIPAKIGMPTLRTTEIHMIAASKRSHTTVVEKIESNCASRKHRSDGRLSWSSGCSGGIELTFAMVMEMDKVVAVVAGTPEVLTSLTKFSEDKGSTSRPITSEMDKG